jgi:hypothetical protein
MRKTLKVPEGITIPDVVETRLGKLIIKTILQKQLHKVIFNQLKIPIIQFV